MNVMAQVGHARSQAERRLLRCLLHKAGPSACISTSSSEPWASALFQGARHLVTMEFSGSHARSDADSLALALPEAEFVIPGHVVAAIDVDRLETQQDDGYILLHLSALTIEEC